MIIGINASQLTTAQKSGIEYTVENIIHELIEVTRSTGDRVVLYAREPLSDSFPEHVTVKILKWPFGKLWTQGRLGWEIAFRPADVFLDISNFFPLLGLFSRSKKFFFAHDYGFLEYPERYPWSQLLIMHIGNFFSGSRASHIFTPTDHTTNQIGRYFPRWRTKTTTVGLGLKRSFLEALHHPSQPRSITVDKPYILFVGRIDPKKNLERLILGFHQWNQTRHNEFRLVLCGRKDPYYSYLTELCSRRGIENVSFTGFVDEQELVNLFTHASAVALVSFGEGFGLPIIEGLAAGKPVLVTTETGGIADTLRDHLVFCDPDTRGIAQGLEEAVGEPGGVQFQWQSFGDVARSMYHVMKNEST